MLQKIHPYPQALANGGQTDRWCALLKSARGTAALMPVDRGYGDRAVTLGALQAVVDPAMSLDVVDLVLPTLPAPAAQGSGIAMTIWLIYSQAVRGERPAVETLRRAIGELRPTALSTTIDDNPEPFWQQEMIILHALHSFALRESDPALLTKTLEATAFHLAEIQPDHATNEPWAVHAYASHADGNVTAETLLHAAHMNGGGTLTETSRWIVAEALESLDAFRRA